MQSGAQSDSEQPQRVREAYAGYAASRRKQRSWSAANPGNVAIRDELVKAVFDLAGPALTDASVVLDIGCGSGWWLARLADDRRVTAELHGVELLNERVTAARARVPSATVDIGDACGLPYPDASVDVVSLFTVLSSLDDRDHVALALAESRRVLAPGGVALVWEPRLPNPLNRETLLVDERLVRSVFEGADVRTTTTTVLPPLARRLGRLTARAYPLLSTVPVLRTHRLVCAQVRRPS